MPMVPKFAMFALFSNDDDYSSPPIEGRLSLLSKKKTKNIMGNTNAQPVVQRNLSISNSSVSSMPSSMTSSFSSSSSLSSDANLSSSSLSTASSMDEWMKHFE